jgi:hypothetical protein
MFSCPFRKRATQVPTGGHVVGMRFLVRNQPHTRLRTCWSMGPRRQRVVRESDGFHDPKESDIIEEAPKKESHG